MEQRFIPDCALALQETGFRIMNVHPAVSVSVSSVRQIIDRLRDVSILFDPEKGDS
jgi:hypothetical protein